MPAYSAYLAAPPVAPAINARAAVAAVQARLNRQSPGVVASVDARRPVPSFVFAARGSAAGAARQRSLASADQAALSYLDQYRSVYQLDGAALATAEVASVHRAGRADSQVVQLRQRVGGRDVYDTRMSFLLDGKLGLVAMAGHLRPAATRTWSGALDGRAALGRAVADVTGAPVPASALVAVAADDEARTARFAGASGAGFRLPQPALVREVFYPMPKELVPAFSVALEVAASASRSSRAYEYVIAADDGRILERRNRTFSEARGYRVWADGPERGFRPFDGPHGDLTPHPTGDVATDVPVVGVNNRILAQVEGLNTNPDGAADPWLPPGATDLRAGNNVTAYADHDNVDGFSGGDIIAPQNSTGVFGYTYSFTASPISSPSQTRAAIAQQFFVTNWLHDWWYDSGFDEAAGNAQASNYGRGGEEGDPLLAEAQDTRGAERNNANMSTPPDGLSPRMQMYIFDGPVTPIGETSFEITAPAALAGVYPAQGSSFGVDALVTASGNLQLVNDGVAGEGGGTVEDGCEPFTVAAGRIALLRRGFCSFVQKSQNAEAGGASAVLIINNDPAEGSLPPMGGDDREVAIPALGITLADGNAIAAALAAGAVAADVTRAGRSRGVDRDGTVDNAIVAHEWGHYLHMRLVLCGNAQCGAMSEGWGDFVALHMMLREGDDLHATYAAAAWAVDNAYFGIRRAPYSVNFERNALTLRHIADDQALPDSHPIQVFGPNSEVHNAGEVWANMLFEAFVALVEDEPALPFAEAQRRMSDYIVVGMQMAPPNPTYTEQSNAILAAIAAGGDERDLKAVAGAFARRGAGTGAVSPGTDSLDFVGVEESFQVAGDLVVTGTQVVVDDDCDEDGNLDGGESGRLLVTVVNGGPIALSGTTVTATAPAEVALPDGASKTIDSLGPFQAVDLEIPIQLDAGVDGIQSVTLAVQAANDDSFHPTVDQALVQRVNFDDSEASSKLDDVESKLTAWAATSDFGEELGWARAGDGTNALWHADDPGAPGGQSLTSPSLTVGDDPLVVRFDHRYSFEASDDGTGTIVYWDGAAIEYSTDAGKTWTNVDTIVDPGYGGEMFEGAGNPLGGQSGFVAQSESYPEMTQAEIDLGTALAGQEVLLRFRVGSDEVTGDAGWDIDNLAFEGIENSPFTSVVDDDASCGSGGDDGADDGGGDGGKDDEGGCGCRTNDRSAPLGLALYAALLVPYVLRRRRRR